MERAVSRRRRLAPIAGVVVLAAVLAFDAGSALAAPSIEGTSASHVTATDATLEATIDPHGASAGVFYQFQLLLDPGEAPTELLCPSSPPSGYSTCAGTPDAGALPLRWISGASSQPVALDLSSANIVLHPGKTYYFRALAADRIFSEDVAEWEGPATVGETGEFTTPEPPSISHESASDISATGATLHAMVDDHGLAATYRFQIAKSPVCLPVKPPYTPCAKVETGNLPQGSLPPGDGPQAVGLDLGAAGVELEPGAKYSFRLVASSSAATAEGMDESFTTLTKHLTKVSIPVPSEVGLEGGVTPRTLPRKNRKPVTLTLKGSVHPGTDEKPVGFKALTFEFDRDGAIFTKGLPTCTPPPGIPDVGWGESCQAALVGHGKVYFDVRIPKSAPFPVTAPLEIFNGAPQHGHPVLIYKVFAHVPAATTYFTSAAIEPDRGRFGAKTTIRVPTIVGGHGALTKFSARIGRTWTYRGRKVSLLSARCSKGSLALRAHMDLTDGTAGTGELTQPCSPKR
jgi:hypothetical protein